MITISHTHADGTLCEGTSKGDGSSAILGAAGRCRFRWSRNLGAWYVPNSRDRLADRYGINAKAEALRAAGFDVTVTIDENVTRTFADAEAERNERAEARADRMATHAQNAAARSTALYGQARQMADAIPFGQPMMPDHYSYGRDRRYRERMGRTYERSFAEADKAEHFERRAANAEGYQASREDVPRTIRRIEKLEAQARDVQRKLDGRREWVSDGQGGHKWQLVKPSGEWLDRLTRLAADYAEQITYWRDVIDASGVKVWGPSDFKPGDYARGRWGWVEVLRVNPKSLTHPWGVNAVHLDVVTRENVKDAMGGDGWTGKATYDDVTGKMTAEEMAAHLAGQAATA